MRLQIAAIGRLKEGPERQLLSRYTGLLDGLGRGCGIGPLTITELPEARGGDVAKRTANEAARLVRAASGADLIVLLDERGRSMSSLAFAQSLREDRDNGIKSIAFLIGGADGHGEEARKAAHRQLSLSPLTLPHGLVRIVLAEQLYRAITIITGHPYHRE